MSINHENNDDFSDRQEEIKLQRNALIEYAENNPKFTEEEKESFTMAVLGDPAFFQNAKDVLEQTAAFLWNAALLHDDAEEETKYSEILEEFVSHSREDIPVMSDMRQFFIQHWTQAFVRPMFDDEGNPVLLEDGRVKYETSLPDDEYELCSERMLQVQTLITQE